LMRGSTVRTKHDFEPSAGSVRLVRDFLKATLAAWELCDLDDVACLLSSELASNAVHHASTKYTVSVAFDPPELAVEVVDGSYRLPVLSDIHGRGPRGRGIPIVEALAHRWGVGLSDGGKTVWFTLLDTGARGPSA
jgi:anti-sigma regulatory factor (Ser/Thr protein kinase)